MKKFLVVLTLLSAYVQSYGNDICDSSVVKATVEKYNFKTPLKLNDHTTFTGASCVNNTIRFIYNVSDESFEILKNKGEANLKRDMCLEPSIKVLLTTIGADKIIRTYINKSLTERFQFSVTEKECKELLPGF
ncbi:hypothetical protein KDD93_01200 [Campylobacter sp. faydin G-24]|uniref:Uncharacterized protein n=1 Tax=Campylobacter anatolicus TaxID=2829105 RepID=A0ABS5HFZ2_9BACT|nr:hypothetical protein [Campylobacter anatolicus]MBR8463191.1 hypothetical protein [Campylobacter anatolicus]